MHLHRAAYKGLDPRLRGDDAEAGREAFTRNEQMPDVTALSFHSPSALPPSVGGVGRRRGVVCLTEPGIVCFPAACPPKAQVDVLCSQRGSITRSAREFRRSVSAQPRPRAHRPSSSSKT